ncbi:hypothetical protein P154DRAFT_571840 [Amniculicola lignicola CBS 123094]|uniref:EthD domain-containing protein n=1 Tax=Amniculicola lignicola CBS 123094 TaxID=1392246 RepID=A0A6A5WUJ7_9PLEO|nr:hypothetical protein P154DRAFT_571840 [Amniculicola lignicola CBS 123094]
MAPQKEHLLKLTSMRYRKPGVSETDFHDYCSKTHAPKAALIQARYGTLKVTQKASTIHRSSPALILSKIPWAVRPGFRIDDHNVAICIWELVIGGEWIVNGARAIATAGWEEVYIEDRKVVNVAEGESLYAGFEEKITSRADNEPD